MSKSLVRSFFNATKALQTLVAKGEKGLAALEHSMAENHHVICHFINLAKNSKKLLPSTQNRQEIDKEVYSYSACSLLFNQETKAQKAGRKGRGCGGFIFWYPVLTVTFL